MLVASGKDLVTPVNAIFPGLPLIDPIQKQSVVLEQPGQPLPQFAHRCRVVWIEPCCAGAAIGQPGEDDRRQERTLKGACSSHEEP